MPRKERGRFHKTSMPEKEKNLAELQCHGEKRGGFDRREKHTHTPHDALQQIGEKESDGYKERGRSNRRESMHTPRCVAIEEIKSFNATKRKRASKLERKRESFNAKKKKNVMARGREKGSIKGI